MDTLHGQDGESNEEFGNHGSSERILQQPWCQEVAVMVVRDNTTSSSFPNSKNEEYEEEECAKELVTFLCIIAAMFTAIMLLRNHPFPTVQLLGLMEDLFPVGGPFQEENTTTTTPKTKVIHHSSKLVPAPSLSSSSSSSSSSSTTTIGPWSYLYNPGILQREQVGEDLEHFAIRDDDMLHSTTTAAIGLALSVDGRPINPAAPPIIGNPPCNHHHDGMPC